ncbi:FtsX-like permease family protein [Streptomyces sp. NPDC057900]|uniref:FtsX-like permease family protein n=1 Tax=Streptomyces sp. NPDC057900 TaxID=3346274 RepID=UPI0036E45939
MSVFTGWRAALRIARRDAMRAKGRSALVVAMIAIPVLGVTALDVTYRSVEISTSEQLAAQLGSADALFTDPQAGPLDQSVSGDDYNPLSDDPESSEDIPAIDLRTAFPKGSRAISIQAAPANVTTGYGVADTEIYEFRTSDPMARGKIDLVDGAFPKGTGEMVATEAFLKSAGLHIGSHITVRGPNRKYTVTGTVEQPQNLSAKALYADPGAVIAPWKANAARDKKVLPPNTDDLSWLVKAGNGTGVSWSDVMAANKKGALVVSRQVVLDPPPDSEVPLIKKRGSNPAPESSTELSAALITVVAMAVLEIVLLAGPAFAVGARRSRRQLGLLGTCGGDRRHVRAVVLSGGLVLGGAGAVVGVVAGLALTALFQPLIEEQAQHRFGSLVMDPKELLAIAVIGMITGVLAALAPAIVAGRQSVLESLTGHRGVRRSSRVLPIVGACALAVGVAIAVLGGTTGNSTEVAAGSVVAELGLLCCIPVIVGFLGRLGRALPLSPRMALRDAARNRGRTAPAVAAVMAAVAGSVAIATFVSSKDAQGEYDYTPMFSPKSVVLYAADGDNTKAVEQLARAAVERNMNPIGKPAEVSRLWAGSDCNTYYEDENDCGSLELVKPTGKGHTCPLHTKGAKQLALRLSDEEHRRTMHSPECVDERYTIDAFNSGGSNIVIGDASLLTTYVKLDDPAAARALDAGTPVLLNRAYAKDGQVTLKAVHRYSDKDKKNRALHPGPAKTKTDRLKVYVADAKYAETPGIRMIMPEKSAQRLGLHTAAYGSVYNVAHPPTDAESQRTDAAIQQAGANVYVRTGSEPGDREDTMLLVLTLFAGVVTVGAAAITTGLSKADAEADLTTLSAVGAPPGVRRTLSGLQCLVVALTGVLLGTAAGLVPAVALRLIDLRNALEAMREDPMESAYTPIVVPWVTIGLLAVVVPLLAGLLAALFTRSRLTLARRAG